MTKRDPFDLAFVTAFTLWVIGFLSLIFTAMIRIVPANIGGPIFVFCLSAGPIIVLAAVICEVLRKR